MNNSISIRAVIFDIDGVLTSGSVSVNAEGEERKSFLLTDLDYVNRLKSEGYFVAAITGENTPMVDFFEKRIPWDCFIKGCKNKGEALNKVALDLGISIEEICYIGDGLYDIPAIKAAGIGVCTANAVMDARAVANHILKNNGGDGCIEELYHYIKRLDIKSRTNPCKSYVKERIKQHSSILNAIYEDERLQDDIIRVADAMVIAARGDKAIYFCGNGGSAADSQHIATEFVSRFFKERRAINAEALSVNTSSITAIGNDYSFEKIFRRQIEAKGKPGDILVGISTSGRSENVWEAFKQAKEMGLITVLLTGNSNSTSRRGVIVDHVVSVPSDITPRIQEMHILIGHIWAEYVEAELCGSLDKKEM